MEIVGSDSSSGEVVPCRPARRRRGPRPRDAGDSSLFLIFACETGYWAAQARRRIRAFPDELPREKLGEILGGGLFLVGAVVGQWRFRELHADSRDLPWIIAAAAEVVPGIDMFGFVEYVATASVSLQNSAPGLDPAQPPMQVFGEAQHYQVTGALTLGQWCEAQEHSRTVCCITLAPAVALGAVVCLWQTFHAVALTRRTNRRRLPLLSPSPHMIQCFARGKIAVKIRKHHGPVSLASGLKFANQIPAKTVLTWLKAAKFLRSESTCPEATKVLRRSLCFGGCRLCKSFGRADTFP